MRGRYFFLSNIVNLIYKVLYIKDICIFRYKELVANGTVLSPLITLADKLLMPAMLVAKFILADHIKVEKLKEKLDEQHSNNDDSLNSVGSTSNLQNYSDTELK